LPELTTRQDHDAHTHTHTHTHTNKNTNTRHRKTKLQILEQYKPTDFGHSTKFDSIYCLLELKLYPRTLFICLFVRLVVCLFVYIVVIPTCRFSNLFHDVIFPSTINLSLSSFDRVVFKNHNCIRIVFPKFGLKGKRGSTVGLYVCCRHHHTSNIVPSFVQLQFRPAF